jgi:hypothetical protein
LRVAFVLAGGIGEKREKNIHQVEANALAEQVACASRRNPRIAREKGVVGEKTGKQTHQVEASALAGRVAFALAGGTTELFGRKKLLGKRGTKRKKLTLLRQACWPSGWLALAGGSPDLLGRKKWLGKNGEQQLTRLRRARWPGGWLASGFSTSGRYPRIVREREKLLGKNVGKKHSPG